MQSSRFALSVDEELKALVLGRNQLLANVGRVCFERFAQMVSDSVPKQINELFTAQMEAFHQQCVAQMDAIQKREPTSVARSIEERGQWTQRRRDELVRMRKRMMDFIKRQVLAEIGEAMCQTFNAVMADSFKHESQVLANRWEENVTLCENECQRLEVQYTDRVYQRTGRLSQSAAMPQPMAITVPMSMVRPMAMTRPMSVVSPTMEPMPTTFTREPMFRQIPVVASSTLVPATRTLIPPLIQTSRRQLTVSRPTTVVVSVPMLATASTSTTSSSSTEPMHSLTTSASATHSSANSSNESIAKERVKVGRGIPTRRSHEVLVPTFASESDLQRQQLEASGMPPLIADDSINVQKSEDAISHSIRRSVKKRKKQAVLKEEEENGDLNNGGVIEEQNELRKHKRRRVVEVVSEASARRKKRDAATDSSHGSAVRKKRKRRTKRKRGSGEITGEAIDSTHVIEEGSDSGIETADNSEVKCVICRSFHPPVSLSAMRKGAVDWMSCDGEHCDKWTHFWCAGIDKSAFELVGKSERMYYCEECKRAN